MDINKKNYLLELSNFSAKQTEIFKKDYIGSSLYKRIKRLLKYRKKYLNYTLAKLRIIPDKDICVKTFWGREMTLPLLDEDSRSIYLFGTLSWEEQNLIKFLIKNLKKNDIFFDIGANYGFYSILAQEIIENGEIHAFEPNPKIFNYLKSSFLKNKKGIFLNKMALSNKIGKISFYDGFYRAHSGQSTILEKVASNSLSKYQRIKVASVTLDNYINTNTIPTVIKIDVEGAESKVIDGGLRIFKTTNPTIAMEIHKTGIEKKFSIWAIKILHNLGYKSYNITQGGELDLIKKEYLNKIFKNQLGFDNLIFKK